MADITVYPIADVTAMLDQMGGITVNTARSSTFTNELLARKMGEFYSGSLVKTSDPAQQKRADEVFLSSFVSGVSTDVTKIGEGIAEGTRAAAAAAVKLPAELIKVAKFAPLIIAAAIGVVIILKVA